MSTESTMSKGQFQQQLVDLLLRIEKGMVEFPEPLPERTIQGIVEAVAGFGEEILPTLHMQLVQLKWEMDFVYLIDLLGGIRDKSSIPYLIDYHQNHASYISGLAAIQALRKIKSEDGYLYMADVLRKYGSGNRYVINSEIEISTMCQIMGEWQDIRAIEPLKQVILIRNANGMPESAIRALTAYPEEHEFLTKFSENEPEIKTLIESVLREYKPFIPADAEWYLAEIVEEIKVVGEEKSTVNINLTLVHANSPTEAYEQSLEIGKRSEISYPNTDGQLVSITFRGLRDLFVIYEPLEHGSEILYEKIDDADENRIVGLVRAKHELAVFRPK